VNVAGDVPSWKLDLKNREFDSRVLALVPELIAKSLGCLPIYRVGRVVVVAVSQEPGDHPGFRMMRKSISQAGWHAEFRVADAEELRRAIGWAYGPERKAEEARRCAAQAEWEAEQGRIGEDIRVRQSLPRVAELLLRDGVVEEGEMIAAARAAKSSGESILSSLVRLGFIGDDDLAGYLARNYGVPVSRPDEVAPSTAALAALPRDLAESIVCCPLDLVDGQLHVAVLDPSESYFRLCMLTESQAEVTVATEARIRKAIERSYPAPITPSARTVSSPR
jgi:hypothetical protein